MGRRITLAESRRFAFGTRGGGVSTGRAVISRGSLIRGMDVKMGSARGMGMRSGRMNPVLS